jgi:hypothetical protein
MKANSAVMPALVAGIHAGPQPRGQRNCANARALQDISCSGAAWIAGTSPAMTAVIADSELP